MIFNANLRYILLNIITTNKMKNSKQSESTPSKRSKWILKDDESPNKSDIPFILSSVDSLRENMKDVDEFDLFKQQLSNRL